MDALSDPRAYLSNQEKRAEQLKSIGVDENDISSDIIVSSAASKKVTPGLPKFPGLPGVTPKRQDDNDEVGGKPYNMDSQVAPNDFLPNRRDF